MKVGKKRMLSEMNNSIAFPLSQDNSSVSSSSNSSSDDKSLTNIHKTLKQTITSFFPTLSK